MDILHLTDVQAVKPDVNETQAWALVNDYNALALVVAPCLADDLTEDKVRAAKAVLRRAVERRLDNSSGALQSETVGPYARTFDTRGNDYGILRPSEIAQLQAICGVTANKQKAYSVSTAPPEQPLLPDVWHPDAWRTVSTGGQV